MEDDYAADGRLPLHCLIYRSTARLGLTRDEVIEIFFQAQRNNPLEGITGVLTHDGGSFVQLLEGVRPSLDDMMVRLRADPRHHGLIVERDEPIANRHFSDWSMHSAMLGPIGQRRTRDLDGLFAGRPPSPAVTAFRTIAARP